MLVNLLPTPLHRKSQVTPVVNKLQAQTGKILLMLELPKQLLVLRAQFQLFLLKETNRKQTTHRQVKGLRQQQRLPAALVHQVQLQPPRPPQQQRQIKVKLRTKLHPQALQS